MSYRIITTQHACYQSYNTTNQSLNTQDYKKL
jgi:hypothetical protein